MAKKSRKIITGYEERYMDKGGRIIIPRKMSDDKEYYLQCVKNGFIVYPSEYYTQNQDKYLKMPVLNKERIDFFSARMVIADKPLHRITIPTIMRKSLGIERIILCSLNGNGDCIIIKPKKGY